MSWTKFHYLYQKLLYYYIDYIIETFATIGMLSCFFFFVINNVMIRNVENNESVQELEIEK